MARRVFFSFHYSADIWRVSQIRYSWVVQGSQETAGFWDAAEWEQVKRQGENAIENWINREMEGTSVTVVLIGQSTAERKWVLYEVKRSHELGKGLLGVTIHNMKNQNGYTSLPGANPLTLYRDNNSRLLLSQIYPTFDWVVNNGYQNFGNWIEDAAQKAGR
jgi:hypothetical protein